jgi:tape measure domain-containing protein
MPELAALSITIEADTSRFDRSLGQVDKRLQDAQGRFVSTDKSADKFGKTLDQTGKASERAGKGAQGFARDVDSIGQKAGKSSGLLSGLAGSLRSVTSVLSGNQIKGGDSLLNSLANISEIIQGIPQIGNLAGALIRPFTDAAQRGVAFNMVLETAQIGFEGVAGSADEARKHIKALKDFGASSSFDFPGVLQASRIMTAFEFSLDEQIPKMRVWGNALAASGKLSADSIEGVAEAFGKMRARGSVTAETMDMLTTHGINGYALLAKAIGKTEEETRKLGQAGKLRGKESVEAITAMMEIEPRYRDMMKRMENTLAGRFESRGRCAPVRRGRCY